MTADKRKRRRRTQDNPTDAEPWHAHLTPGLDTPDAIAYAKERLKHDAILTDVWRKLVNFYEVHKYCPRRACRRAHTCTSPEVACFYEAEEVFREHVFPQLRKLLARDRGTPTPPYDG